MTPQRHECLIQYGRVCVCCGERRIHLLEIDHVDDGRGNQHRRQLAPRPLEHVLAEAGYPEQLDGHVIQLHCQPCHRSKTKYGSCQIDHEADVMDDHSEEYSDDTSDGASIPTRLVKGSQKRKSAQATVMLSMRVSAELKERFDGYTNHGKLSQGEVLKQVLDDLEVSGADRHRELVALLKSIQQSQRELLSTLSDVLLKHVVEPESSGHTPSAEVKQWLDEAKAAQVTVNVEPSMPRLSRFRRYFLGR